MIHALDIIKTTDRIIIESSNIKMTILSNVYLIVSPYYTEDEVIPVKISYKKSDMTDEEFQKESYKSYFSGLSEVKIKKDILINNSSIMTKFVLNMINLNWISHQVFVAKQNKQDLTKIRLPIKVLKEFDIIFDNYENMLITKAEGFNKKLDILYKFYST